MQQVLAGVSQDVLYQPQKEESLVPFCRTVTLPVLFRGSQTHEKNSKPGFQRQLVPLIK